LVKKLLAPLLFKGVVILILSVLILYPLSKLVISSFTWDKHFSLQNFILVVTEPSNYQALYHSLFVAAFATFFSIVLGSFLAWIVVRTDIPYKNQFKILLLVPYLIPPFMSAFAWMQLVGPVGYLNQLLMLIFNRSEPLFDIYGKYGIIMVSTIYTYPLVYLMCLGSFERMNPDLEEVAQISGAGKFRVMLDITFPIMKPVLGGAMVIVFITVISMFGIPALLGIPASYFVLTTRIYQLIVSYGIPNNFAQAAALSMILVVIGMAGLLLQRYSLRKKSYAVITGKSMQPTLVRLGYWRNPLLTFCIVIVFVTSVAPVTAVTITAITKALGLPPTWNNFTLKNFYYVLFQLPLAQRGIRNSIFLAIAGASITLLLGSVIAYINVRTRIRWRAAIDLVASAPYAIPGIVIGLAMILAWIKPIPLLDVSIYNTMWIILIAYIVRFLIFPVRSITASLYQVDSSLEDAARISGADIGRTFRNIVIPLIKPGILSGWFLVFMPALTELTLSILLYSAGSSDFTVILRRICLSWRLLN